MSHQTLLYQKKGQVATVTLNRPDENNAINTGLAMALADVCAEINQDQEIRAVTITGAGKVFSVGTDWSNHPADIDLWSVATTISQLNCPVIAAINGDALGQGLELALACDLRIAAETASLGLPGITAGIIPFDGGTQRLPRLVGRARALEMVLLGEPVSAGEAHRIGLVHKVVAIKELLPAVNEIAQKIAVGAPLAMRYAREAVDKGLELTMDNGLRLETDLYALLQTTVDRTEGITAHLNKRPPQFKGK